MQHSYIVLIAELGSDAIEVADGVSEPLCNPILLARNQQNSPSVDRVGLLPGCGICGIWADFGIDLLEGNQRQ